MTFPRIWPAGVAAAQELAPLEFETLDIDHTKAINGVDGDVVAGPLEFSDCDLTGTSSIDITGSIATTTTVDVGTTLTVVDEAFLNYLEVAGNALFNGNLSLPTTGVDARTVLADRVVPRTIGTQTIETDTAEVLALDFTLHDTFVITLDNAGDPTAPAVLATVATLTDTSGTAELQVKPGAKLSITFKAGSTQTGGIGISSLAGVFPASFHGISKADLVGPRSGALGVGGGTNDWMRLELENIGTTGTPKYACKMTMGSG